MSKKSGTIQADNLPAWIIEYPGAEGTGWYLAPKFGDIYYDHPDRQGHGLLKLPFSPKDRWLTMDDGTQAWEEAVSFNAAEAGIDIGLLDVALTAELAELLTIA